MGESAIAVGRGLLSRAWPLLRAHTHDCCVPCENTTGASALGCLLWCCRWPCLTYILTSSPHCDPQHSGRMAAWGSGSSEGLAAHVMVSASCVALIFLRLEGTVSQACWEPPSQNLSISVGPQEASKCLRMWRRPGELELLLLEKCRDALGSSETPLHLGACIE